MKFYTGFIRCLWKFFLYLRKLIIKNQSSHFPRYEFSNKVDIILKESCPICENLMYKYVYVQYSSSNK